MENFIDLKATGASSNLTKIYSISDGGLLKSPPVYVYSYVPHRIIETYIQDSADVTWGYATELGYRIADQRGAAFPEVQLPISETFTTGLINDSPHLSNNWIRGNEVGDTAYPSSWFDNIKGQYTLPGYTNPVPRLPIAGALSSERVQHFSGYFSVGSLSPASGYVVQEHVWQRFIDHARHENIVSPAP